MSTQLYKLIKQGEHQRQDFKYCISDSRKIARTLSAFANTEGGSLLIGVKDNGHIIGVQSEEEYYMVEAAARIYCNPPVAFTTRQWPVEGKSVLEAKVEPSALRPHYAKDEAGAWHAYIRHNDENRLAGKVLIEVWKKQKRQEGILVQLGDGEKFLLEYLKNNEFITLSAFARKACLPYRKAEKLLSDFIVLGIVNPFFGENLMLYQLNKKFDVEGWENSLEAAKP